MRWWLPWLALALVVGCLLAPWSAAAQNKSATTVAQSTQSPSANPTSTVPRSPSANQLPAAPAKSSHIETAGPSAASAAHQNPGLPATARTATGDVPLGGSKLRAKAALPPLVWDPRWARFGPGDIVVSGLFATAGVVAAIVPPIKSNRRSGGILFDDEARDVVRLHQTSGRFSARDASDSILSLLITYPVFIDSVATAWWLRGNADVARQMALIDLEAMAITVGIQGVTNMTVARERPYGADCGSRIPGDINDCTRARRYRSFFSGHAAQAFTAAGLICYHHMKLRLLGPGPADALTCASGMAAAGAVATLRMAGDMHYASDVLIGASVGTLVGLGVPFLHYTGGLPTLELSRKKGDTTVSVMPSGLGVSLAGQF